MQYEVYFLVNIKMCSESMLNYIQMLKEELSHGRITASLPEASHTYYITMHCRNENL